MRKRILIIAAALLFVAGSAGVALYASMGSGGVYGVCLGELGSCTAACPHCGVAYYADGNGEGKLTSGNCEKCGKDVSKPPVTEEEGI